MGLVPLTVVFALCTGSFIPDQCSAVGLKEVLDPPRCLSLITGDRLGVSVN